MRRHLLLVLAVLLVLTPAACGVKNTSSNAATALQLLPVASVDAAGRITPVGPGGKPTGLMTRERAADPAGNGRAVCGPLTIAMAGPLTGPDAAWGRSIRAAVRLSITRHNDYNPGCRVTQRNYDTEADPQKATQVVPGIVDNPSIVGMIGPLFSGENKATGQVLNDAGLLSVNSSATNASLSKYGWRTFFRGLGNDDLQGAALARYMTDGAGYRTICVLSDNTDYGVGLAATVRKTLGAKAIPTCSGGVKRGEKDFSAVVSTVRGANPDAVFFAGYFTESALLARQLKDGGSPAKFVAGDASNNAQFVSQAGEAARGAILSCPCEPLPDWFMAEYEKLNNLTPGLASIEAYDLTTIMLRGIDAGRTTRAGLRDFVAGYRGDGVSRTYQWNPDGELVSARVWMYEVR